MRIYFFPAGAEIEKNFIHPAQSATFEVSLPALNELRIKIEFNETLWPWLQWIVSKSSCQSSKHEWKDF